MEALLNAALVGTGRQASPAPVGDAPTEELLARLPAPSAERQVLLRAGAWAAYRLAGHTANAMPPAPEPAPPETLRHCTPRAAQMIVDLLAGPHASLLPEALARLRQAGQIIPPDYLLPMLASNAARSSSTGTVRTALVAALGERGRWLAAQNEDWRWALETVADDIPLPSDAESIWQEGTPARRRALFAQVRHADPARAREWLAAVWPHEKVDMRTDLVNLLRDNLGAADEPLLTQMLNDRSAPVRAGAAALLARIPTSALARRMRERADGMLSYTTGRLQVKPPKAFDPAWQRDGIAEDPPRGTGKRAWWLMRVLEAVPPDHWSQRFGVTSAELIAAAGQTEFEAALIEGWSWAALAHAGASTGWIVPLWEWWLATALVATPGGMAVHVLRDQLGVHVPPALAEARTLQIMNDPAAPANKSWDGLIAALPVPWSGDFGAQFLSSLRAAVATLAHPREESTQWHAAIPVAAVALPKSCFAQALAEWTIPELETDGKGKHTYDQYLWNHWQTLIERLCEALRLRQTLYAEIRIDA